MYGNTWAIIAERIHAYLRDAIGALGVQRTKTVFVSATDCGCSGFIYAYRPGNTDVIPFRRVHVVADLFDWELVQS